MSKINSAIIIASRTFTSYSYYLVIPFLLIHFTQNLHIDLVSAGGIIAICNVFRRGMGIPAGYFNDRFNARNALLIGLACEFINYCGMIWASRVLQLLILNVIGGTGGCLYNVSSRFILANSTATKSSALEFGYFYITMHIGAFFGLITFAFLNNKNCLHYTFIVAAIIYGLAWLATLIFMRPTPVKHSKIRVQEILAVFSTKDFMLYCILISGGWFLFSQIYISMPLYVVYSFNDINLVAYLHILNAIIIILLQYKISKMVSKSSFATQFRCLAAGTFIMGCGWAFCIFHGKFALCVGVTIFTLGEVLFISVVDLLTIAFAPARQVGVYIGFSNSTWAVGAAVASLICSSAFEMLYHWDMVDVLWSTIFIFAILLSFSILLNKNKLIKFLCVEKHAT